MKALCSYYSYMYTQNFGNRSLSRSSIILKKFIDNKSYRV